MRDAKASEKGVQPVGKEQVVVAGDAGDAVTTGGAQESLRDQYGVGLDGGKLSGIARCFGVARVAPVSMPLLLCKNATSFPPMWVLLQWLIAPAQTFEKNN